MLDFEYVARNNFKPFYEKELGGKLWQYLIKDETVSKLERATLLGYPAVEGIGDEILQNFGEDCRDNSNKQMIGDMVGQIMLKIGYKKLETQRCGQQSLFNNGMLYEKI